MQSSWGDEDPSRQDRAEDDFLQSRRSGQTRGTLGQLIERSTSAPPPSSEPPMKYTGSQNNDSLVGSGLLEYMNQGYQLNSQAPTPLTSNHSLSSNGLGAVMLGAVDNSGRATAPSSNTAYLSPGFLTPELPLSSTGAMYNESYGEAALKVPRMEGLVRSQSAAPAVHTGSTIGPPPGMTGLKRGQSESHAAGLYVGQRRSASTGVLGNSQTALRPSAKTLMDLIQEDESPEDVNRADQYAQQLAAMDRRSTSPAPSRRVNGQVDYGQLPQERPDMHSYARETLSDRPAEDAYELAARQQLQQVQLSDRQTHMMPRYDSGQPQRGVDGKSAQYSSYQPMQQQQQSQQIHSQLAPPAHHLSGGQHGLHGQQLVMGQTPHQQQQQIYYGGQQQRVEMQPARLQTQVLPSGQTVYMNAPPPPSQPGFGYTTVQYHPQQPQVIHQQMAGGAGGGDQQYVSVVPMQGGGPQVAYWQTDVSSTGQGMNAGVTLVNAPPSPMGAQSGMGRRGGMDSSHANQQYGRSRDSKGGGRGRKGGGGGARRGTDSKQHSMSSHLLDEFRSTKNRDWTIPQIEGHIVDFCQDQNGSRFIQQRLEMGDITEQQIVMREVLPAIRRLRNDVFGNYVIQKLLDFGTPQVRADIRDTLRGEMLQMSLQMYGCRVVQKALGALSEEDLPELLSEFHHNVLSCIHDQNGNHVIQKCIEVMNSRSKKARQEGDEVRAAYLNDQINFIVDDVLSNTATLSCHPYGCRVLQRILEHCNEQTKTAALDEIATCHRKLLDDQYGNYVIQHVLQYGRESDRDSILQIVLESGLLRLSRQKFASNVVEKLLKYGSASQRTAIVHEMLKRVEEPPLPHQPSMMHRDNSVVLLMVRDAYANYVVQTTLDVLPDNELRRELLNELNAHSEELRNFTFAKHIVTKLNALNESC